MDLRLTVGTRSLEASLLDVPAARDFATLLPLTVTLSDFHATEKIADLPRELATTDAPPGTAARRGDIAYYAPWGNLAIFYRDFEYAPGLVTLGTIRDGIAALDDVADGDTMTIEVTEAA